MYKFLRQNFRWIAGGFLLTYGSSFGQTFFISASIAEWQAAFDLSHGDFGQLYMFATLASALCLPVVGRLVDIVSARRAIVITIAILCAATLLAAHAPSVSILALAVFLLRLFGQGMMTHIALTATGRWFSAQRGRAVSLVVLGHQSGEATLPILFASLAVAFGYRAGWIAGAVGLMLIALPLAVWAYAKPRMPHPADVTHARASDARSWTRGAVLRDPVFWVLLSGVLAPPFIGTTIFYHQDYLTTVNDWPPRFYAGSLSIMAATTVVFALICGAIIDRYRATSVLPFFLLPLSAACFALGASGSAWVLVMVMMLLGTSYGFSSTLFGALWPEIYGTANLGAIRSVIVSIVVFATAAGPGITGTLIDYGIPLATQMAWLGVYCLLAIVAMSIATTRLLARHTDDNENTEAFAR